jgi:GH35 family endo-1,4-beta-xylanase
MQSRLRIGVRSSAVVSLVVVCGAAAAHAPASLKQAFKGDFVVGAAINEAQITGQDQREDALIESQFNSISPENALKWANVHPQPGKYNFDLTDKYIAFGQKHHMFIVGHNLVWHEQVPDWVFHDDKGNPLDRDALLARMKDHIYTVVGRYKGKIQSWDVVNEALNEDGTLRQSMWYKLSCSTTNTTWRTSPNGTARSHWSKSCKPMEFPSAASESRATTTSTGPLPIRKTPPSQPSPRSASRLQSLN